MNVLPEQLPAALSGGGEHCAPDSQRTVRQVRRTSAWGASGTCAQRTTLWHDPLWPPFRIASGLVCRSLWKLTHALAMVRHKSEVEACWLHVSYRDNGASHRLNVQASLGLTGLLARYRRHEGTRAHWRAQALSDRHPARFREGADSWLSLLEGRPCNIPYLVQRFFPADKQETINLIDY